MNGREYRLICLRGHHTYRRLYGNVSAWRCLCEHRTEPKDMAVMPSTFQVGDPCNAPIDWVVSLRPPASEPGGES